MPTIDGILKEAESKGVKFVELEYVDLNGTLRNEILSLEAFKSKRGGGFDASSVGLGQINWSDAVLVPDPETAIIKDDLLRFLSEIWEPFGGSRSTKDPRFIAARIEEELAGEGMKGFVGPEIEFITLTEDLEPVSTLRSVPKVNYHFAPPSDPLYELKLNIMDELVYLGLEPEVTHHEVGVGQSEISVKADTPLRAADKVMRVKRAIREVATDLGLIATFMPKPIPGDNGSGMHIHMSLWNSEGNLFYDPDDDYAELSQLGRYFIGGILDHINSLSAIVAPTVNSYKRLVPGYEAPIYAVWGRANRSAAVRVPVYRKGGRSSKRVEFRVPDPSCNPYLAFAASFAAGLDGIRRKIDPGDPADVNVYATDLGAKRLPRSLHEALDELENDHSYLMEVFTSEALEAYIEMKRREASEIGSWPSEAEYMAYLNV
ncbi:MAG TPA: glutamine synthetase [Candidatus Korarchaeota archaeon]|nr:glutamine synthetase [Candidatus Korarchaeota archaeon]